MAWRIPRVAIIAVFITVTLSLVYLSRDQIPYYRRSKEEAPPPAPAIEVPRFEIWGIEDLSENVQLSSVKVTSEFQNETLPVKQQTDLTFSFSDVNLGQPVPDLEIQSATIIAPTHHTPDASHMIIGLATTLDRLLDALPAFARWASGTGVRFIVVVKPPEPGGTTFYDVQTAFARRNIAIMLIESALPWYSQYVSLLAELYDQANTGTKWACIIDDDTYFFSMQRVLAMLNKYDANEEYYIGGLTENKEGIDRNGILAYGGAGVFLSIPLLRTLRPHNEACIAMPDDAGDWRIAHCITTYSLTKFTWEHYLFQMDLHGDVTGFYEAARTRPVSTHHWHSWHVHDMAKVGAVGEVCGNECVLQKYVTTDGYMITNGFSIVKYSWTKEEQMKYIEGAMEHTWADTIWVIPTSWNYTLAPLRPKDPEKIQYVIEKVDEDDTAVTIYYVRRFDGLGRGIIRMIWQKMPHQEQVG